MRHCAARLRRSLRTRREGSAHGAAGKRLYRLNARFTALFTAQSAPPTRWHHEAANAPNLINAMRRVAKHRRDALHARMRDSNLKIVRRSALTRAYICRPQLRNGDAHLAMIPGPAVSLRTVHDTKSARADRTEPPALRLPHRSRSANIAA